MPSVNASTPKPALPKKTNNTNTSKTPSTGTPNLKRSGSPDLSESGTDKRKKPRKTQPSANTPSSGQDKLVKLKLPAEKLEKFAQLTQITVSQAGKKRKAGTGGAGSGDDGEMSESSKKQRIKIVSGGRALSPSASRQGSPDASRAGSPAVAANTRPGTPAAEVPGSTPPLPPVLNFIILLNVLQCRSRTRRSGRCSSRLMRELPRRPSPRRMAGVPACGFQRSRLRS